MDVGHGQVMGSIAQNPRVTVMEKFNLRYITPEDLPQQVCTTAILVLSSMHRMVPQIRSLTPTKCADAHIADGCGPA